MSEPWRLSVRRAQIGDAMIEAAAPRPLQDGEVRFGLQRFALTANNVTYAAFGDALKYWEFFPSDDPGRGVLPVWGFADVIESRAADVNVGERFYGIWPAADEAILTAGDVTERSLRDRSPHRADQAAVYTTYRRCSADPGYAAEREPEQMTLQPLYATSFLLHRYLDRENAFGAERVLFTSASSKTAIALAELVRSAPLSGVTTHALTSTASVEFVESTGLYNGVTMYDEVNQLDTNTPAMIVDFAGNRRVNLALHQHLAGSLRANVRIGGAHWVESAPAGDLPGPQPIFFFAPTHYEIESKADGPAEFQRRLAEAWIRFATASKRWFDFQNHTGSEGCLEIYRTLVDGRVNAKDAWCIEV